MCIRDSSLILIDPIPSIPPHSFIIEDEWWMMNDEWWVMNDERWMMNDAWGMNDEWCMMLDAWWMIDDGWWMNDEWWMMNDEWGSGDSTPCQSSGGALRAQLRIRGRWNAGVAVKSATGRSALPGVSNRVTHFWTSFGGTPSGCQWNWHPSMTLVILFREGRKPHFLDFAPLLSENQCLGLKC